MNKIPAACQSQKSFYGKARVVVDGEKAYLQSYNTFVCCMDENGQFHRLWSGWSATTARHVNAFRSAHGLSMISKKEWLAMEIDK